MQLGPLLRPWRESGGSRDLFAIYRIQYPAIVSVPAAQKPLFNATRNGKASGKGTVSAAS